MKYGLYKNARNAAWQCLIDFNVRSLPVNVADIAQKSRVKILKNSNADLLKKDQSGMTVEQKGKFYIIYRDTEPRTRCRFTIAHELGHILLGHVMVDTPEYRTFDIKSETESAANIFARDILAPACVLHELGAETAEDIAKLCDISLAAARIRAERLQILEERDAWYRHPLERKVRKQFSVFIKHKGI